MVRDSFVVSSYQDDLHDLYLEIITIFTKFRVYLQRFSNITFHGPLYYITRYAMCVLQINRVLLTTKNQIIPNDKWVNYYDYF